MSNPSPNEVKFNCDQVFSDMEIVHNVAPLLKTFCRGKILDLGAGSGAMANYIKDKGEVTCVDFSKKLLERIKHKGISIVEHDLNKYPYPLEKDSFDTVVMLHVLEHLLSPYQAIEEIYRLLKIGGRLILAVPNTSDFSLFPKPEPAHYYHFNSRGLKMMLENFGFKVIHRYSNVPLSPTLARFWNLFPIKYLWEGLYLIAEKRGDKVAYGQKIRY